MLWDYRISLRFKVKVNMAVDNLVNESVLHHYNKIPEVIHLQNINILFGSTVFFIMNDQQIVTNCEQSGETKL